MIDLASAVIGAAAIANGGGILYAAYLRGQRDALAPASVQDMDDLADYHRMQASIDALEQDVEQSG